MNTSPLIFIDGDQGTTGLQIHEHLRARSDLRLLTLPETERKVPARRAEAINACDIALLCLPDSAAREAVAAVVNPSVRIIDASSAHRTNPAWVYGFPEMSPDQPRRIANAQRVSNPGCYPTGAIALLRPLIQANRLPADYPLVINAVSGYSGGGRAQVLQYEGAARADAPAFAVYGLGLKHKHAPEIERHVGLAARPVFLPSYGGFRQGIVLTIALQRRLLPPGTDGVLLHACLREYYKDTRYVQVMSLEDARSLEQLNPQALNGTNNMRLGVFSNEEEGQILLSAVFDNLGKGAAGAAVQNLDLMLSKD